MAKKKERGGRQSVDKPALPLTADQTEEPAPLTAIQQAAYSAAIFAESSSD